MLKHDPEYYPFLFDENDKELISSMIQKEKDKRISIDKVASNFANMMKYKYSKETGLLDDNGNKVETHPEDQIILDLLGFFKEFDKYEDIEIDYQITEYTKKVEESESLTEKNKERLYERLKLVKKQLYHKFDHKEFEYTRGPMVIDDIE